jgi:hypothetical protein
MHVLRYLRAPLRNIGRCLKSITELLSVGIVYCPLAAAGLKLDTET